MCKFCDDTGSLSKDVEGFFDCGHCGVAEERTALEAWADAHKVECYSADLWLIYQRGKAAAKPVLPQAMTQHAARLPQPRMVERRCVWCKGTFQARAVDVARGWGKFCSKSCKASKQELRTGQYRAISQEERGEFSNAHLFSNEEHDCNKD